jgi:hypothetical protein
MWGCFLDEEAIAGIGKVFPRTWGCFYRVRHKLAVFLVFPTHVGVFLKSLR